MTRTTKGLNFTYPVERGAQRFRELIVYISEKCEHDPNFGAVKLNKNYVYWDFRAFERFGRPLTGVKYFRLPFGPAPQALFPICEELAREGAIQVQRSTEESNRFIRTIALREPFMEHFTRDEIFLVNDVIEELWHQTATEVSDASHDVRWRTLEHKDNIPCEFAFLSNEPVTEAEIKRTRELAEEFGWQS